MFLYKRLLFCICLLPIILTTVITCSPKTNSRDNRIRVAVRDLDSSHDWVLTSGTYQYFFDSLMRGFFKYDFIDGKIEKLPQLLKSWRYNPKTLTWRFTIKNGIEWSDGAVLTAQHFVDGWHYLLNSENAAPYSYVLFPIKNAQAYNQNKVSFTDVGIKVRDNNTIDVTLDKPYAPFLDLFTFHVTYPIRMDLIRKFGKKWTEPGNMATLGPYVLKSGQRGQSFLMTRNRNFHLAEVGVDEIEFLMISSDQTNLNLLQRNQLDIIPGLEMTSEDLKDRYPTLPVRTGRHERVFDS